MSNSRRFSVGLKQLGLFVSSEDAPSAVITVLRMDVGTSLMFSLMIALRCRETIPLFGATCLILYPSTMNDVWLLNEMMRGCAYGCNSLMLVTAWQLHAREQHAWCVRH